MKQKLQWNIRLSCFKHAGNFFFVLFRKRRYLFVAFFIVNFIFLTLNVTDAVLVKYEPCCVAKIVLARVIVNESLFVVTSFALCYCIIKVCLTQSHCTYLAVHESFSLCRGIQCIHTIKPKMWAQKLSTSCCLLLYLFPMSNIYTP